MGRAGIGQRVDMAGGRVELVYLAFGSGRGMVQDKEKRQNSGRCSGETDLPRSTSSGCNGQTGTKTGAKGVKRC